MSATLSRDAFPHRPRVPQAHTFEAHGRSILLAVDQGALYPIPGGLTDALEQALNWGDSDRVQLLMAAAEMERPVPPSVVPAQPRLHAFSLAIAQKCNLGCTYCYAGQGSFGAAEDLMPSEVARAAVDRLVAAASPGESISLAFLGGEPLINRAVLREVTQYAAATASAKHVRVSFALTTNATLLTPEDAALFDQYRFTVTVSIDGPRDAHNRLRPFKSGQGSFDRVMERAQLLLSLPARRGRVLARVTVTPDHLALPETLRELANCGFDGVQFSPVLSAPSGLLQIGDTTAMRVLEQMIVCGEEFERQLLEGRIYPFSNLITSLQRIHRGTPDPYPCGAGGGYMGVSSSGNLYSCHRFVNDDLAGMGDLAHDIDLSKQRTWIESRHVDRQQPCSTCWARYLCGGSCHYEALHSGRGACDYIRGWLHYTLQAYVRLVDANPPLLGRVLDPS